MYELRSSIMKKTFEKVIVHVGLGKKRTTAHFDDKVLPEIMKELSMLTGQKPAVRTAKKSIANFKTRTGDVIGLQATLRGERMEGFLSKLIHVVFPRLKDFRGIDVKNVDHGGNLNIGLRDQFVFPEINMDKSNVQFGLQITVVPKNHEREEAIEAYRSVGMPLKKEDE